jgi:hypothetical protein
MVYKYVVGNVVPNYITIYQLHMGWLQHVLGWFMYYIGYKYENIYLHEGTNRKVKNDIKTLK